MNKNKLITFILNDISELDMLTRCMESMETIPYAMHDLALQKVRNILSEFEQLSVESKEEACKDAKASVSDVQTRELESEKAESVCVATNDSEVVEKPKVEQEQEINVIKELVSPEKNATTEINVTAKDTVKVVERVPEPIIVEELRPSVMEKEVQDEVANHVEAEKPASAKNVEKTTTEQPKATISNSVITNERFKGGRRLESRFVTDLRKALNFNDKFRYQKELFGGDMALLNSTIERLNAMSSLQEAEDYVAENFNWNTTEGAALEFMELLEARFTN